MNLGRIPCNRVNISNEYKEGKDHRDRRRLYRKSLLIRSLHKRGILRKRIHTNCVLKVLSFNHITFKLINFNRFDNYTKEKDIDGEPYSLSLFTVGGQEDYDTLRPLSYPNVCILFYILLHKSILIRAMVYAKLDGERNSSKLSI